MIKFVENGMRLGYLGSEGVVRILCGYYYVDFMGPTRTHTELLKKNLGHLFPDRIYLLGMDESGAFPDNRDYVFWYDYPMFAKTKNLVCFVNAINRVYAGETLVLQNIIDKYERSELGLGGTNV